VGGGGEQQVVEACGVIECQRVQFVGHGEYDVEVVGVEQFLLPCFDPSLASLCLALRTASVTAGVIGDTCLVTAAQTHIEVSAEGGGAATADCPERLELLEIEAGEVAFQESVALRTEDISDLHGGRAHGFCERRKARRLSSTFDSVSSSSGLCTSCRCRWERWRYFAVVSRSPWPSRI
jgi:hypothetical protein